MPVKKIDISLYCNHRLIYKKIPEKESYGLDNICVLEQDFLRKNNTDKHGSVCDYCLGDYDNIVCDEQTIFIGSIVKKWHFIGFAYWGDVKELIKIIFDDDTEDWLEIAFIDWSHFFVHDIGNSNFAGNNQIENVLTAITSGNMVHLAYLHDCICEFCKEKTVKEII